MKPKTPSDQHDQDLFRQCLDQILDLSHELCRLRELIDWQHFETQYGTLFSHKGRAAISTRLMVGLHYLKHLYNLSDEQTVSRWVENPYWQYFCGESFFQHKLPIHPTSMTKWRHRLGADELEALLEQSIEAAIKGKTAQRRDLKQVTADTTVQEKAVAFPTDSRLYHTAREALVKLAKQHGLKLRQSYVRKSKQVLCQNNRYGQARQSRRMKKTTKRLKTMLGCVYRDIERQLLDQEKAVQTAFESLMSRVDQLMNQPRSGPDKVYSLHAPEVECIAKGKSNKRYEFGVKASFVVTQRSHLVVGAMACPGRPYDGKTLIPALDQVERLTGQRPHRCYVDQGYKKHGEVETEVYATRQKRGVTRAMRQALKRCNAIEPIIGHIKQDGRLGRNYLKGEQGDAINIVLSAAGQNLRHIFHVWRVFFAQMFSPLLLRVQSLQV